MPTTTKKRCPKCKSAKWFRYVGALKEDPMHPGNDAFKCQKITNVCHDCKFRIVSHMRPNLLRSIF